MERLSLHPPSQDGGILLYPDYRQTPSILNKNRELQNNYRFTISGIDYSTFRKRVRDTVITLAEIYTRPVEKVQFSPENADTIIQTGHQPIFFHPGVWLKNFFAYHLAKEFSGISLNT